MWPLPPYWTVWPIDSLVSCRYMYTVYCTIQTAWFMNISTNLYLLQTEQLCKIKGFKSKQKKKCCSAAMNEWQHHMLRQVWISRIYISKGLTSHIFHYSDWLSGTGSVKTACIHTTIWISSIHEEKVSIWFWYQNRSG